MVPLRVVEDEVRSLKSLHLAYGKWMLFHDPVDRQKDVAYHLGLIYPNIGHFFLHFDSVGEC